MESLNNKSIGTANFFHYLEVFLFIERYKCIEEYAMVYVGINYICYEKFFTVGGVHFWCIYIAHGNFSNPRVYDGIIIFPCRVSSLLSSSLSHYTDLVQSPHSAVLSLAGQLHE